MLSISAVEQMRAHTEQMSECVNQEQINAEQIHNYIFNNWKEF